MNTTITKSLRRFGLTVAALSLAFQTSAFAAIITWTGNTSGDASVATNWSGDVAPVSGVDRLNFGSVSSLNRTVTFNTPFTAIGSSSLTGALDIVNTSGWTIGGSGVLTLDSNNASGQTMFITSPSAVTISNNMILQNSAGTTTTITQNSTASTSYTGNVTLNAPNLTVNTVVANSAVTFANLNAGSSNITVTGLGTTAITNGANVAGNVTITGNGTLSLGSPLASTATVQSITNLSNTQLQLAGGATYANKFLFTSGGTFTSSVVVNSGVANVSGNITGNRTLFKTGAGTIALSGNSTAFTGQFTITQGTLQTNGGTLSGTNKVVLNGGTLDNNTAALSSFGTLGLTDNSTIDVGTGQFAFANSSALSWTGSLTIAGTFLSGSSLRFGTDNTGLTAGQLTQISGITGAALDASGYLTGTIAVPEPSTYAALAGALALGAVMIRRRRRS